jgi:hypothetical protein
MRLLIPSGNESGTAYRGDHLLHGLTGMAVLGSHREEPTKSAAERAITGRDLFGGYQS